MKITSEEDLNKLKEEGEKSLQPDKTKILVGLASCGKAAGADGVFKLLKEELGEEEEFTVGKTGCLGFCSREPLVEIIKPDGNSAIYQRVTTEDAKRIASALKKGKTLKENVLGVRKNTDGGKEFSNLPEINSIDFYRLQNKIVLKNSGIIDPTSLSEYVAQGGYSGLLKALTLYKPKGVIEEIKESNLRGRGGAGFPTGIKWEFVQKAQGEPKYLICNADEGDPGAYMDRSVLEGDPFAVLEGMTVGAYATGATKGYLYVRAEYPVAVRRLQKSLEIAREYGLLGENIMGQELSFDIEMKKGAGAFVCGEETALIASIESKRGMPRPKPPYPAISGVWGKPTNINNVETWANVPKILDKGANWFASIGTEKSGGTKVFSLTGDVENTGLVEVPMGTKIGDIVFTIGDADKERTKAVQTGGPSGGVIPKSEFDTPVDYEKLQELGSIMGSGGMIVIDNDTCVVELARFFFEFLREESCGKCTPCRKGTKKSLEILERITQGEGKPEDVDRLKSLADTMKKASLCGLGQTAPNPVLSTIKRYQDEYDAHVKDKVLHCPAGQCIGFKKEMEEGK